MTKSKVISIEQNLERLKFVSDRKPDSTEEDMEGAFAELSDYRDGAIYLGHYAGSSEWERHQLGDEIVMVLEGETTLILLEESREKPNLLRKGEMLVVPANMWHRFETPDGVKIMSVTPEPGDHQIEHPSA